MADAVAAMQDLVTQSIYDDVVALDTNSWKWAQVDVSPRTPDVSVRRHTVISKAALPCALFAPLIGYLLAAFKGMSFDAGSRREAPLATLSLGWSPGRPQPGEPLLHIRLVLRAPKISCRMLARVFRGELCLRRGRSDVYRVASNLDWLQVIFGGASSAGILGDLWIFDTFTR